MPRVLVACAGAAGALIGAFSGDATGTAAPPILAGAGGTMTRCDTADEYVGFRVYALGVHGTSRATVVTTAPDGAADRSVTRIDPAAAGVEVTLPVRARGNGAYRLVISQGERTMLDASVTRACR